VVSTQLNRGKEPGVAAFSLNVSESKKTRKPRVQSDLLHSNNNSNNNDNSNNNSSNNNSNKNNNNNNKLQKVRKV